MEKSGLIAVVVAVVMLLLGGYLAYDGYSGSERQKNDGLKKQAEADRDGQKKKADDMEDRLTKLSAVMGFSDLRNWVGREAYLKAWTSDLSASADKLTPYGIDTSKTLSEAEIAIGWAVLMQAAEDPKKKYEELAARDDEIRTQLKNELDKKLEAAKDASTPEMSAEQQEKNAEDAAAKQKELDASMKQWGSPGALSAYLNAMGDMAKAWKERGDWAPAAASDVKALLDALDKAISTLNEKIKAAIEARDKARADLLAVIGETDAEGKKVKAGSMADEEKKKDDAIKDLQSQITSVRNETAELIKTKEAALAALDKEIYEETTKLNLMMADKQGKIKELESKLSDTKERLAKLQARQAAVVETTEADGQILFIDLEAGIAHVDLGRVHTLFRGTRFEVFRVVKAGKKKELGEIEILDLGDERSRAAVVKVNDPSDPPSAGDLVSNVAFDRHRPKVFSIAGQLKFKYSRDDMRRRLAKWGARVSDDVTPATSFLIVGSRYQEDPNWQRALDIGTPIVRERELYDALGIR